MTTQKIPLAWSAVALVAAVVALAGTASGYLVVPRALVYLCWGFAAVVGVPAVCEVVCDY